MHHICIQIIYTIIYSIFLKLIPARNAAVSGQKAILLITCLICCIAIDINQKSADAFFPQTTQFPTAPSPCSAHSDILFLVRPGFYSLTR